MPYSGTLDVGPLIAEAPLMAGFDAEPWSIEGVEMLQATWEIDDAAFASGLPPALHPTIPPIVYFNVARYPESPVGAFTLAQVRLGCRASALPRGFLLRAFVDTEAAAGALASNWGYGCEVGEVRLQRYHDRIEAVVRADGAELLRVALVDPEPISGGDIQYVANMNLARTEAERRRAGAGGPGVSIPQGGAWAAGAGVVRAGGVAGGGGGAGVADRGVVHGVRYGVSGDPVRAGAIAGSAMVGTRKIK